MMPNLPSAASPRLLDQVRQALDAQALPTATRQLVLDTIRDFLFFHRGRRPEDRPGNCFRHPADMGGPEIAEYLRSLGGQPLTRQAQARTALLLLYHDVLRLDPGEIVLAIPREQPPKLLDRMRDVLRLGHYSPQTEESYIRWVRRFILHHGKRH